MITTRNGTFHNPDALANQVNSEEVKELIPLISCLILISVIGLPGNGLICYVYGVKSKVSTSSRWFIFFLGSSNLIQCMFVVPGEVITTFFQYNFTSNALCKTISFLNCSSLTVLAFTLVIVAVDRYRKVCKPHGVQIKLGRAKLLSGGAVVMALLISVPLLWVYGIRSYTHVGYNITVSSCSFSNEALNSSITFYYIVFGMLVMSVSLATICILYTFIGRSIRAQLQKQRSRRNYALSKLQQFAEGKPRSPTEPVQMISLRTLKDNGFDSEKETRAPSEKKRSTCSVEGASTYISSYADDVQNSRHLESTKPLMRTSSRARTATISLFLISLAFVLSYLPTLLLLLVRSVNSQFEAGLTDTETAVYKFFLRTCYWNCAMNPFLLALSDTGFRAHCLEIVSKLNNCL